MAEAGRSARAFAGPEWILAHRQTMARGRRGRVWTAPPGNFAATLLMLPQESPDKVALRSFVASLALYDVLADLVGAQMLSLKWPNDVLLNGGKVAGILLERFGSGHLAIGIGVNLAQAPAVDTLEAGAVPPAALADYATLIQPEEMLDLLAPAYARYETQFATYGFAPIRTAWLERAARLGQKIRARTMTATHHGVFETMDEQGQLVLSTGQSGAFDRRLTIPAADVFFE